MSLRGQIRTIKRRLGVREGYCPACGCPADVTRVLWICPIGVPFPPEERRRKLDALPKCGRCGKPLGMHMIWPDRAEVVPPAGPAGRARGRPLTDEELNAAIAAELAKLEAGGTRAAPAATASDAGALEPEREAEP